MIYYGCPESIEVNGQKVLCHKNHAHQYLESPGPEFKHYGKVLLGATIPDVTTGEDVVEVYLEIGWRKMKRVRVIEERTRPA